MTFRAINLPQSSEERLELHAEPNNLKYPPVFVSVSPRQVFFRCSNPFSRTSFLSLFMPPVLNCIFEKDSCIVTCAGELPSSRYQLKSWSNTISDEIFGYFG